MKKLFIYLILLSCGPFAAQNDYSSIKRALQEQHPSLNLADKIIVVNTWSAGDNESREFNKALNKTVNVYEFAKLKGGVKGVIGVTVYKGSDSGSAILLNSDQAGKLIQVNSVSLSEKNTVFDSNGQVLYNSLPANKLFESIHKLVTR